MCDLYPMLVQHTLVTDAVLLNHRQKYPVGSQVYRCLPCFFLTLLLNSTNESTSTKQSREIIRTENSTGLKQTNEMTLSSEQEAWAG